MTIYAMTYSQESEHPPARVSSEGGFNLLSLSLPSNILQISQVQNLGAFRLAIPGSL